MRINKMKTETDGTLSFWLSRVTFAICFFVSVGLIIGGFFVPPMGIIDGSVLTAVGELLLFPTLLYGFRAVELGMSMRFQHGDTSVSINNEKGGHHHE
jgi:hypothetical protein